MKISALFAAVVLSSAISAEELQAAAPAATTVKLTSSPNPSKFAQSVTLTATISPAAATGTVTFNDGSSTLGTGSLTKGTATLQVASLAPGTHSLTAAYAGDTAYKPGTSSALTQTVSAPAGTAIVLVSSHNPSGYGETFNLIAQILPATATGEIKFLDNGVALGTSGISGGIAIMGVNNLPMGVHSLTASYAGDRTNPSAVSPVIVQTVTKAITTTVLTASANPAGVNQTVTFTATISPPTATGSVTFNEGSTALGTSAVNSSGVAVLSLSNLAIGAHSLTAVYSGDANCAASTSAVLSETVSLATTTTTLKSSANPSPPGQSITLTATVSPASATGNVNFNDGSTTLGSSALSAGVATLTIATLSNGTHSLTAVYAGDGGNAGSTSAPLNQVVSLTQTSTTLKSSANPSTAGQSVTLTATVSPPSATGSVTFKDGSNSIGTANLSGGAASLAVTSLSSGAHSLTAAYAGDSNNAASSSASLSQTVNPATTTTSLTSSANPSTAGQTLTLTATVSPSTATGAVTFKDGSNSLGTANLSGGAGSLAVTSLSVGAHSLTAAYAGDANNAASTSAVLSQTVNPATTTTSLTSSANPSTAGQTVTLTATVSPSTATGAVTFKDGSNSLGTANLSGGAATLAVTSLSSGAHSLTAAYAGDANNAASTSAALSQTVNLVTTTTSLTSSANPSTAGQTLTLTATVSPSTATGAVTFKDGSNSLGTANLSGGAATLAVTSLSSGAHSLTAAYAGDANNAASTSAALSQTVNLVTTTTSLTSSANPSTAGQIVTLTATVSPPTATGAVTFKDGSNTLGPASLNGGSAILQLTSLPPGTHSLTAVYGGDANDAVSTSAVLSQTVNLVSTTTSLTSSSNPSTAGQGVTLTATVSPGTCTGSVTFKDGASTLGSGKLSGGTAMLQLPSLAVGTHSLTAVYSGDVNDAGSTSPVLSQTVNPAATNLSLTSSSNPAIVGQSVTLTAVISPSTATGAISFNDGLSRLGTVSLSGGTAALILSSFSSGTHSLTAVYDGDANNAASTSPALLQVVNLVSTTTWLASSANPSPAGQSVTLTATVSPASATGTMTFRDGSATLGSAGLSGGAASLVTSLASGVHSLTAVYGGDSNNLGSTSAVLLQTVNLASTTIVLTTSANPSAAGESLILTATVAPATATGTVSFQDGNSQLGTGALTNGTATLSISSLALGAHSLTAIYVGDTNNAACTSAALLQNVTQASTTTTLVSSPNPSHTLDTVTLTATIAPASASGVVTFNDGTTPLGTSSVVAGTATLATTALWPGVHNLTAVYGGDTNNAGSSSAPLLHTSNGLYPAGACTPSFTYVLGQAAPAPVLCRYLANVSGAFTIAVTDSWLQVTPSNGQLNSSGVSIAVSVNPAGLSAGQYAGSFTISGPQLGSQTVNVPLIVTAAVIANPGALSFNYQQQSPAPPTQRLTISSNGGSELPFTIDNGGAGWLKVSTGGTAPQPIDVTVDPTGLAPNSYTANLTVTAANGNQTAVPVSLNITPAMPPQLSVNTTAVNLFAIQGGAPAAALIPVANTGGTGLTFSATTSGSPWLNVAAAAPLVVRADPSSLDPGTYQESVTITAGDTSATVPISFTVAAPQPVILVSQTGLHFTAAFQGGAPLPQRLAISNGGAGTLNWTAAATTVAGGDWLRMNGEMVAIDAGILATLAPGEYAGQIQISDPAATLAPVVTVLLSVLQPGADPGPEIRPGSLVFASPDPQTISVAVTKAAGDSYISRQLGTGFAYSPAAAAVQPSQPVDIQVVPDFSGMTPGQVARGNFTLQFSDGTARTVNILTIAAGAGNCANLNVLWRAPSATGTFVANQAGQTLEVHVVDDCGNPLQTADGQTAIVQATFSPDDPPLNLTPLGNGIWTGYWQPGSSAASGSITVTAVRTDLSTGQMLQVGQASPLPFALAQ